MVYIYKLKCEGCGYEWQSRPNKIPKCCPKCKVYKKVKVLKKVEI